MIREDENDLGFESQFFKVRGTVKNPRAQKKVPVLEIKSADLITIKKKKTRRGNAYQHTRTGARVDLGDIVCRSSWEADVLRVLQLFKISFKFEPTTFYFPEDAIGRIQSYLPDIYLPKTDEYIEVKGMLDARGRNKLRKFKKNYPDEFSRLSVVISKSNKTNKIFFRKMGVKNILFMEHLNKLYARKIAHWEGPAK